MYLSLSYWTCWQKFWFDRNGWFPLPLHWSLLGKGHVFYVCLMICRILRPSEITERMPHNTHRDTQTTNNKHREDTDSLTQTNRHTNWSTPHNTIPFWLLDTFSRVSVCLWVSVCVYVSVWVSVCVSVCEFLCVSACVSESPLDVWSMSLVLSALSCLLFYCVLVEKKSFLQPTPKILSST